MITDALGVSLLLLTLAQQKGKLYKRYNKERTVQIKQCFLHLLSC